jgi:hypothetical protein
MMSRIRSALLVLAVLLAGCSSGPEGWPTDRPGAWRPSGANEANLRAMVADPSHLVRGVGASGAEGPGPANAVDRLYRDRVRPLPQSGIVAIGGQGGGGSAPAGGAGGGQ